MSVSQAGVSRTSGELDGLVGEIQAITDDTSKVFGSLSPAQQENEPYTEGVRAWQSNLSLEMQGGG